MVRILKSLRFPPQNRAISPDTRLPSPPRSLTEMTESRISVILFCKNSFYLQSRPPSSRDVFHRRRLWRIQTMENAEGWHSIAVTEGVSLLEGRFSSSPPVADSDDGKRRRLAQHSRDGRSFPLRGHSRTLPIAAPALSLPRRLPAPRPAVSPAAAHSTRKSPNSQ